MNNITRIIIMTLFLYVGAAAANVSHPGSCETAFSSHDPRLRALEHALSIFERSSRQQFDDLDIDGLKQLASGNREALILMTRMAETIEHRMSPGNFSPKLLFAELQYLAALPADQNLPLITYEFVRWLNSDSIGFQIQRALTIENSLAKLRKPIPQNQTIDRVVPEVIADSKQLSPVISRVLAVYASFIDEWIKINSGVLGKLIVTQSGPSVGTGHTPTSNVEMRLNGRHKSLQLNQMDNKLVYGALRGRYPELFEQPDVTQEFEVQITSLPQSKTPVYVAIVRPR